ncbi:signal transduction histidine kinase [Jonquetella anthropi DSM 22815]|uniref:Oxygen sensor histidine kinase NreB n=1 Tax=Jonquetella anthropi DSM 22815 TaxID=885272 RepID=H0UME2_9BACT|nr:ATP-binding protein [Jonquetella anthropi]EHM12615.1 signal transduction histidine kinase [Jonquetella anthropi DSM 22815]
METSYGTGDLGKLFFEQVFDPIAVYRVNPGPFDLDKVMYLDVNKAYEKVMKVKREQVIGRSFAQVWPNGEARWSDLIRACVTRRRAARSEGHSPSTGTYLEAMAFYLPPDRVAVIFFDQTKWKAAASALQDSQEKLRNLAARLTLSEEQTRREIAADIHDRVGYSLVSLLHLVRELKARSSDDESRELSRRCQKEIEGLVEETRTLIFKLSPPVLKDLGLNFALETLAENIFTPLGIGWTFQGDDDAVTALPVDDEICVLLYRMTRELLINITKHSKAKHAAIRVRRGQGKIQVIVEDDGVGFVPPSLRTEGNARTGYGLFSIRERLLTIDGQLNVLSEPGKGTTVVMTAPRMLGRSDE